MVPFGSLGTVFYSHSIVTIVISCIISEIKRDIGRKSHYYSLFALDSSVRGFPSDSHNVWYRKTRMVWLPGGEKVWRYDQQFWHRPITGVWQTDGLTDRVTDRHLRRHSPRDEKYSVCHVHVNYFGIYNLRKHTLLTVLFTLGITGAWFWPHKAYAQKRHSPICNGVTRILLFMIGLSLYIQKRKVVKVRILCIGTL